jgi:hypothetical protein
MTTPFTGYPISVANRIENVVDYTGPVSYVTGGDIINARDLQMSAIDFVSAAQYSSSATYVLVVLYPLVSPNAAANTVTLAWYVGVTGLQVTPGTNLSGEHVRLRVIGI